MSAKSLAQLAAKRDTNQPGQSVVNDSTDVLVAAVPTEALTAYTAVIGVVLAANIGTSYGAFRWSAYGAFIALAMLAPAMLAKRNASASDEVVQASSVRRRRGSLLRRNASATNKVIRELPVPECLTAGVAAAAWGLVMPGNPLTMIIKGNALVFATTAILVGTAAIITLAAQQLGTANSREPVPNGKAPVSNGKVRQATTEGSTPAQKSAAPAANGAASAATNGATSPATNTAAPVTNTAALPTANGADPAEAAGHPDVDAEKKE